jgi:hypothetical protein
VPKCRIYRGRDAPDPTALVRGALGHLLPLRANDFPPASRVSSGLEIGWGTRITSVGSPFRSRSFFFVVFGDIRALHEQNYLISFYPSL